MNTTIKSCKEIEELPILQYLSKTNKSNYICYDLLKSGFPSDLPNKLILAKLKQMIKKQLIDGCTCGCRGDFYILEKGKNKLIK